MTICGLLARDDGDDSDGYLPAGTGCVGWRESAAPPAHAVLRQLRVGDLVFLQSFDAGGELLIRAVGAVTDARRRIAEPLDPGVHVHWVWHGEERVGRVADALTINGLALYEERHPEVRSRVLDLLLANS